jgi:Zn-dependent protease with chaperone function
MSFLAVPVIALAFFMVAAWGSAAVVYPAFSAVVRRWPAVARSALLVAAFPVVVGLALALAAFLPGDPHLDQLFGCHCDTSMPGWLHLCPLHPTTAPGVLGPAVAALVLLGPGRIRAMMALVRAPLGTGTGAEPTQVDLPQPIALLAGWLRPSLLVDRHLWASLEPAHREAVLAHERAHITRRDPLVLAALRLLTSVAPRAAARRLMRDWLDHAELRADAAAASSVSPLTLAEALVACARVTPTHKGLLRLAWTSGNLDRRVRALVDLAPGSHDARPDAGLADLGVVVVALLAGLACIPWLHHQVEHLLNLPL